MKTISIKAFMTIAEVNNLDVLVGDISTAYLYISNSTKVIINLYDSSIDVGTYAIVEEEQ